ncbi:MAG: hypothetical protein OEV49_11005 [candidate division Zixibacteria bacterium]|nr:hypothetical protein [candidate division Zixibacteria bacterium]MDH3935830.1 hypothetical protein [candidate division Zixibacteria bacterium]MDH4035030.1 hypothetical protein [candidate division Zixibacteria bacterium]
MIIKCLFTVLFFLILVPVVAAQVYVTTEWDGFRCGGIYPFGADITCSLKISNPDTLPVDSMVMVFTHSQPQLGTIRHTGTTYLNNFENSWAAHGVEVVEEDSLLRFTVLAFVWGESGSGLPSSSDTVAYIVFSFEYSVGGMDEGGPVCFDSSSTPEFQWFLGGTQTADWSGQACYETHGWLPNCCLVELWGCSSVSSWSWSEPMGHWFSAETTFGIPRYELLDGPGEINWYSGLWTYTPTEGDAGLQDTLVIRAVEDWCGDGSLIRYGDDQSICSLTVSVGTHGPPQFPSGKPHFIHSTGDSLAVTLDLEDGNPCNGCLWSYWISEQDPIPPGLFDSTTGTFYYTGTSADTNTYYVVVNLDQNGHTDVSGFFIHHYDSYTCGDMNHRSPIDIGDLVWLVDFMFSGGPTPITQEAGNVDCAPGVDISDLVYFVDWMFQGGPAPCASCPKN